MVVKFRSICLQVKLWKRLVVINLVIYPNCGIAELPFPDNTMLSIHHSILVKGDHTYFKIDPSIGVEASELYPEVKYTTPEEYLDQFVWDVNFYNGACLNLVGP